MNLESLKAKANQLKTELLDKSVVLMDVLKKASEDYKRADSFESFVKTFYNEELVQKPERIPVTAITVWILLLVFHGKFWIVFVFGVLPFILYYLLQVLRKTPTAEY